MGRQAATWKCWSPSRREDVYLACRELGGALKTSLHESGSWHTGYLRDFFEESVPEEHQTKRGPYVARWSRPTPMALGVTLAFRIVTPWSSVMVERAKDVPGMVSVPAPGEKRATEFLIVLVDAGTPVGEWPGKNTGHQLVGSYGLPSSTTVWIVWREIPMPQLPTLRGTPEYFRGTSLDDLKDGLVGLLLFGDHQDGSRIIYDCVARYEG
jgi:hypothetical protein